MLRRNDKIIGRGVVGPGEKQCPYDGKIFFEKIGVKPGVKERRSCGYG